MSPRRSLLALGALGSAMALSGCVAAVIPLAAGALMATSGKLDGGTGSEAAASLDPVALAPDPALAATAAAPAGLPQPTFPPSVETAFADFVPLPARTSDGLTVLRGPPPAPSADRERIVDGFLAHALDQAQRNPVLIPRQSALLAEPGLLRPERMECGRRPPAVILDLDPGRESFDPLTPVVGNPRLAAALAGLREREVTVFWTSHLGEGFADALRGVLAETGLDPTGRDRLLLLRSLDQRKHTLRTEIAGSYCVVAMLGDERADFDELFYYLRQPDTALQLDAMLGSGWFLSHPISSPAIVDEARAEVGGEPQP